MQLDGEHCHLSCVRRGCTIEDDARVVTKEGRCSTHGFVACAGGVSGVRESPAPRLLLDECLLRVVDGDTGRGKHAAVVDMARSWPVLVDRALAVDQHWTMAPLVVAHQ